MEIKAQQKNQEQFTDLEAKLHKVESQLTELEGKKTEGGRLVATPEITKSIEDFRHEQAKLRASRREIRKSLREGIAALENRSCSSTSSPHRSSLEVLACGSITAGRNDPFRFRPR